MKLLAGFDSIAVLAEPCIAEIAEQDCRVRRETH